MIVANNIDLATRGIRFLSATGFGGSGVGGCWWRGAGRIWGWFRRWRISGCGGLVVFGAELVRLG